MDLNALPDDTEEEEVEVFHEEEEDEEEEEAEAAGDGELDAEGDAQAGAEDGDDGDGEVEIEHEDEEPQQQEDDHQDHQQQQEDRAETAVEILRREREERRALMKRKLELDRAKNPNKAARTASTSTPASASSHADWEQAAAERERSRALASLPEGWLDCPNVGEPVGRFIPSKVPLGEYYNGVIQPGKRYSWKHVLHHQRAARREVVLVIDLTFTTRYYSSVEVEKSGVKHIKIACRGRNEVPDNESVNRFIYEASRYFERRENTYIFVHCTHGFNRTGYMIVNYLVRVLGYPVEQAVKEFAAARNPGIYKRDYVEKLYEFYHERFVQPLVVPTTPEWKRPLDLNGAARDDDDDDDGVPGPSLPAPVTTAPMTIDDVLGDAIPEDLQLELQRKCLQLLGLRAQGNHLQFPGSQPVSLDRKQLTLLRQKYYYATWKADGTRYMMLITTDSCFLIDRKFKFRRVQMRFPMRDPPANHLGNQQFTLLDGEMVIDKDEKGVQSRRYLVYDLLILSGVSIIRTPFSKRWSQIESEVVEPRRKDARQNRRYNYDSEPFRVRRKDFWLLSTTEKLLHEFIPNILSHEADGLIFQGWDDEYVCKTHHGLLKWKYAHMNSVDFFLKFSPEKNKYCLYLGDRGKHRELDRAAVVFPEGIDPADYDGKIIECSWKKDEQVWEFMRVRLDKELANAFQTYEKVMGSINDNITEEVLFDEIKQILNLPMYKERTKQLLRQKNPQQTHPHHPHHQQHPQQHRR